MLIAPDVFEPDDDGYARVVGDVGTSRAADAVRRAELNCPARAIRVQAPGTEGRHGP